MDEFVINDFFPEKKNISKEIVLTEKFADCFREIGQPPIKGLFVLVQIDSEPYHWLREKVIGIPVLSVEGPINGLPIGIAVDYDTDTTIPRDFTESWKSIS